MLSIMVAMTMSMAAKDPLEAPRKVFSNCLIELHNDAIKNKQSIDEFKTSAEAACPTERKAFSDAVYKLERPSSKEAEAQERSAEEAVWVVEWIVDLYTGNKEDGSLVTKQ